MHLHKLVPYSIAALAGAAFIASVAGSPIPATAIFESLLLALPLALGLRYRRDLFFLSVISAVYVAYFFTAALSAGAHVLDVLVATKVFVYLLVIGACASSRRMDPLDLERLFKVLLAAFIADYGYSRISGDLRPGLFTENNFELMLLFVLAAGVWQLRGRVHLGELVSLAGIVSLSGSRSGALEFVLLLLLAYRQPNSRRSAVALGRFVLLLAPLVLITTYVVVSSRFASFQSIEDVDRYAFLMIFLGEVQKWGLFDWLTGSHPLSPLSEAACIPLSYYDKLLSYSGDATCYSVLLHSMILRMVFDHGILGLVFVLFYISRALRVAGYDNFSVSAVIGILLINGVSVSSFNSVYACVAVALLVSVSGRKGFARECSNVASRAGSR